MLCSHGQVYKVASRVQGHVYIPLNCHVHVSARRSQRVASSNVVALAQLLCTRIFLSSLLSRRHQSNSGSKINASSPALFERARLAQAANIPERLDLPCEGYARQHPSGCAWSAPSIRVEYCVRVGAWMYCFVNSQIPGPCLLRVSWLH
jgi:hypothetical protein